MHASTHTRASKDHDDTRDVLKNAPSDVISTQGERIHLAPSAPIIIIMIIFNNYDNNNNNNNNPGTVF